MEENKQTTETPMNDEPVLGAGCFGSEYELPQIEYTKDKFISEAKKLFQCIYDSYGDSFNDSEDDEDMARIFDPERFGKEMEQIMFGDSDFLDLLYGKIINENNDKFEDLAQIIKPINTISNDFEKEVLKLINYYCALGLKKHDLVHKIQYISKSCELS